MCAFDGATGHEDEIELRNYLIDRRAFLFSGAVQSETARVTHICRDPESDTGGQVRIPYRQTHDGAYTERWCRQCMYYIRSIIPEGRVRHD